MIPEPVVFGACPQCGERLLPQVAIDGLCPRCAVARAFATTPTVQRATLFDGVVDTFATETELNGWRAETNRQGALL